MTRSMTLILGATVIRVLQGRMKLIARVALVKPSRKVQWRRLEKSRLATEARIP